MILSLFFDHFFSISFELFSKRYFSTLPNSQWTRRKPKIHTKTLVSAHKKEHFFYGLPFRFEMLQRTQHTQFNWNFLMILKQLGSLSQTSTIYNQFTSIKCTYDPQSNKKKERKKKTVTVIKNNLCIRRKMPNCYDIHTPPMDRCTIDGLECYCLCGICRCLNCLSDTWREWLVDMFREGKIITFWYSCFKRFFSTQCTHCASTWLRAHTVSTK